jgi:hypothetical protein
MPNCVSSGNKLTHSTKSAATYRSKENDVYISSLTSLFWKTKHQHAVCVSVNLLLSNQLLNAWTNLYDMAPKTISTAYIINPFHQPLYLYLQPPIVARQLLGNNVLRQTIHTQKYNCWTCRFLCSQFRIKGRFIYLFIYCKFTIYSMVYNKSNK